MNLLKFISDLREERQRVDGAIKGLEQLQGARRDRGVVVLDSFDGQGAAPKRRGRPPGSKNKPKENASGFSI
jgi:hypothetical protein